MSKAEVYTPPNVPLRVQAAETKTLIELLKMADVGQVVPYGDLSKAIGVDVQTNGRHYLTSARRALEHEGIIFDAVRAVGVVRLNDGEIVDTQENHIRTIRRRNRRQRIRMEAAKLDALDATDRYRLVAGITALHMIDAVTKKKTRQTLLETAKNLHARQAIPGVKAIKQLFTNGAAKVQEEDEKEDEE